MVMLYPKPTIFSKHIFVPFNANAERLGEALTNDPELQSIAQEYGYRTNGEHKSTERWAKQNIIAPENLVDVIDPPSYEWLEKMIVAIEAKFH
jgi:cbb3-type cytochrome oxidase cytochrome c subunit